MTRRGWWQIGTTAVLVAVASACSSSAEVAEPTPTTVATTIATTTTVAPTTNTAPTTTASPWTDDELAVIQAYEAFRTDYEAALRSDGSDLTQLLTWTTPVFGDALIVAIQSLREDGAVVRGTYEFEYLDVRLVDGAAAEVTVCAWDQVTVLIDGAESPADPAPLTDVSVMHFVEGRWLFGGDAESGSGEPCEL